MTDHGKALEGPRLARLCGYARQRGVSEIEAIEIYAREVERLEASAKVRSFISIIAERIAKDELRARMVDVEVHAP